MIGLMRKFALVAAAGCALIAAEAAQAAGAFAVGACGAYGYGYDYRNASDARSAAIKKCSASTCKVIGSIHRGCAAMAVDAKNPCGPYGWAVNSHLGKAENTSLQRCYDFGGRDCVVRAWACDEKG
jgi:Domain of unknown function (DUF4189)